jgi:hypothetical protein
VGHTKVRCKEPIKEDENADGGFGGADAGDYGADSGSNDFGASNNFGDSAATSGSAADWGSGGGAVATW